MTLAAGFGTGQVLWSLGWLALFVIISGLFMAVFLDIAKSDDLSGWGKALWTAVILVLPLLGAFVYLTIRGDTMSEHLVEAGLHAPTDPVGGSTENELFRLDALHAAGEITDAELEAATDRLRR